MAATRQAAYHLHPMKRTSHKVLSAVMVAGGLVVACVSDESSSSSGGVLPDSGSSQDDGQAPITPDATVDTGTDAGPIPTLNDATMVVAGFEHTCALRANQDIVCWGSNANGQLGVPPAATPQTSVPIRVALPNGAKATSITAGAKHTCALLTTGKIFCWGGNLDAQLGRTPLVDANPSPDEVTAPSEVPQLWKGASMVRAGGGHTMALVTTGQQINGKNSFFLWGWGKNVFRQLVRDSNGFPAPTPLIATFDGLPPNANADKALPFINVSLGDDFGCGHAFLPLPNGSLIEGVICFGANGKGQIGTVVGTQTYLGLVQTAPSTNMGLPRLVATGSTHACAVAGKAGGGEELYCWGDPAQGKTGAATPPANPSYGAIVPGVSAPGVTVLAAGGDNTCIVEGGKVRCIGANDEGQLGAGPGDGNVHAAWSDVATGSASSVAIGKKHVCLVSGSAAGAPGPVSCWGLNRSGQLGDGMDLVNGYGDAKFSRGTPLAVLAPK